MRTPAFATPVVAALIGAAVTLAGALVVAVAFPDDSSLLGTLGNETGTITEALRDAVAFLQAGFEREGFDFGSPMPVLFLAFPLLGCAAGAFSQAARTATLPPLQRLLWGALTAVPFALLMLVVGLGTGDDIDPRFGSLIGFALLWGAAGGVAGTVMAIRRDAPETLSDPTPAGAQQWVKAAGAAARPLVTLIALMALLGAATWVVQTVREVPTASNPQELDRSTFVASVENALFAVEHGIHLTELGAGAKFTSLLAEEDGSMALSPIPVTKTDKLFGEKGEYRLFRYGKPLKVWMFIPLLLVLLGAVTFFALYAGFSTARAVGAATPQGGALWGSGVGVVWSILMAIAEQLARTFEFLEPYGQADGESVFVMFLLGGAALGALGGYLALGGFRQQTAS
jgi:hypothetical protein